MSLPPQSIKGQGHVDTSPDSPYTRAIRPKVHSFCRYHIDCGQVLGTYSQRPLKTNRDVHLGMGTFAVFSLVYRRLCSTARQISRHGHVTCAWQN